MRCLKCNQPDYHPSQPCPHCQFEAEASDIETLTHLRWLLAEIDNWPALGIDETARHLIQEEYAPRRYNLEVDLRLRLPRFTVEEAQAAWPDLFQREILLQRVTEWQAAGWLRPGSANSVLRQAEAQIADLREQLEGYTPPDYPPNDNERLAVVDFLLQAVDYLSQHNCCVSLRAELQIRSPLLAEKERLEIALGLRPATEPVAEPAPEMEAAVATEPAPPTPEPPPPPPTAIPLRERLWQTLLSERTLQALLFLGIFLLFSAAISFVVWGWQNFSAPLRVAIPTGFTIVFFGMGWYVRTQTPLYRSGIALSAIAALLIPIDFYTVYANFNIPVNYWPLFWLITSLACLSAYTLAAFIIRSRLFGYLVATAAGSAVLALIELGHQSFDLSLDWRTAGLSLLALGLILLARTLDRDQKSRYFIFAEPFRYLALLAIGVIMPLTFGWRYLGRYGYDALHYALTINWWTGGFIFGWAAVQYRSRTLGLLAAIALPVATYLAQAALFDQFDINPAWHAVGLALLTPLYLTSGYKLLAYKDDPIIQGHGYTATRWGVALLLFAALWSLTDLTNGAAAAVSHTILTGTVMLAALLWRQPFYLYGASLLSLSATTFVMTEFNFTLPQLSIGWAALAIGHIILALNVGTGFPLPLPNYAKSLVKAGYAIAGLAMLPPLFPYDGHLLAYALGNWLALAAWGARLAHTRQAGFTAPNDFGKSIFHWFTALPLPLWLWLLFDNRGPLDFSLPLALAVLAWGMVGLSYWLACVQPIYRQPWYTGGLLVSLAAPFVAFLVAPEGFTPAITLILIGLLYFVDAVSNRQAIELAPAGLVTAWGYLLLLNKLNISFDAVSFGLTLLIAVYYLGGLWSERQKSTTVTRQFLTPLYITSHILALSVLWRIYIHPFDQIIFDRAWTDAMRLWGAAAQLLLGLVYGLYAWSKYKERWGHVATWLIAASGGFIAITFSSGRGSSAAKAALLAILFILTERALHWLRQHPRLKNRQQTFIQFTWRLYRRPLLVTGWSMSIVTIALALIRNLWLLGGGRTQQIWAVVGLLLISGLYALSARLFKRARFVWLAALLILAPWTILTNLGWFTAYRPTLPGYALSWTILAWLLFLVGLLISRLASRPYVLPLKAVAQTLLPFSLLWGVADIETSRFTFALAIGLYGLAAALDYVQAKEITEKVAPLRQTKFLYPALGLVPVWCVYLLAWLLPAARHEHYGLMLLAFGPLGLVAGEWLKRVAPAPRLSRAYALPGYLTGYVTLITGTMLVAHEPPLLALTLLFDTLLMLVSARLFRNSLWLYPATVMPPISLLLALNEAGIAGNRHGWWLIGLASIYLALAWALRQAKLPAYSAAPLVVGFALIALGLPPSSQDQIGALWGYGSAALLYAVAAFWLGQPLLLTPASAIIIVPYAIGLQRSGLASQYYGLALFPGAVAALVLGWQLDRQFGDWRDFPWERPAHWAVALGERLLGWWGLSLYTLGFGLAIAAPFFTDFKAGLSALNFLLLMPIFGWAIYRFRLRLWLLATALAGHLAAIYYLSELGWWLYPAWACLRFLPVTLLTALVALFIEKYRGEGSPLNSERMFKGWSHLLYIILLFDITIAQILSLQGNWAAATITLTHAILIAIFVSVWLSGELAYVSLSLGIISLVQWALFIDGPIERLPVILALLALGYGAPGYGVAFIRQSLKRDHVLRSWLAIWELPLQRLSLIFSFGILIATLWLGLDIAGWTIRAFFGLPFRQVVELMTVQMVVGVFALLGLLYLIAAAAHRWLQLGYAAFGMLLTSWMLQVFYIQRWENLQWYTLPAGIYILSIAYAEWQRGHKDLGRWLDYTAILLMVGSLFWQTMLFGWLYALMLGSEGLAAFWWGSARRLRRFLYAGMMSVMLATIGQLVNSLWSINQWIVFGGIGLLLVILAIVIERKLDDIKIWQETLEAWE